MLAYINAGFVELGLREGALALANNPVNADVRAAFGLRLAAAGRFQKGISKLTTALEVLLPGDPCWDLGLYFGYLGARGPLNAMAAALRLPAGDAPIFTIARLVAHIAVDQEAEAKDEFVAFKERHPQLA
jgi:hypothetical protein